MIAEMTNVTATEISEVSHTSQVSGGERIALLILGDDTQPGDENVQTNVQTENLEPIVLKGASSLGFIVGREDGVEWEIENIAIAGPARRRGLGTRLLGQFDLRSSARSRCQSEAR